MGIGLYCRLCGAPLGESGANFKGDPSMCSNCREKGK